MKADIEMAIAAARRCIQEAESLLNDVDVLIERGAQEVGPAAEPLKDVLAELRAVRTKIDTCRRSTHAATASARCSTPPM